MIRNYLAIALRFMLKQMGFTVINIFGLTVGITCSLLILLYVNDELRYDRFHPDADRIYRLGLEGKVQGKKIVSALTGSPIAAGIQSVIPELESTIRVATWATFPVRYSDQAFTEKYLLLADSNFFRFFNFELIAGDPDDVLTGAGKIVISESAARRYFDYKGQGDLTPIGKKLMLAQGYEAEISGIAKDSPLNSHFHYSLILSLKSWDEIATTGWINGKVITYFKLAPEARIKKVSADIISFLDAKVGEELKDHKIDITQFKDQGDKMEFFIQPMLDVHLKSHNSNEIEINGDIQYIYLFSSIAIFITLLACINFMNLSTARSVSRAKEVGVRKTVGAQYGTIIRQFLLESYLYIFIAVAVAFLLVLILITPFNYFTEKQLSLRTFGHPFFFVIALLFTIIIGLLAGSYPAFYLTRYGPLEVLKGKLRASRRRYGIRNILVIFQFFISASLIIATVVVYQQLNYLHRTDLGFEKDNVVDLLHTRNLGKNAATFKAELLSHPEIVSASYCNRLPPNIDWQATFRPANQEKDFLLAVYEMDYDHLKTMGYSMSKGRFFSIDSPSDSQAVILNEAAAKKLGLENFQGKKMVTTYDSKHGSEREMIGIMKDFNFQSLKDPIQPLAIILGYQPNWEMAVRLTPGEASKKLSLIKTIWKKHASQAPFEFTFLDKNFDAKQEREKRVSQLFVFFTILAIVIACLGLFGLATFTAEQRTKEIGIRKVLGATMMEIGAMLNYDILKLVLFANLIAWPVSGWIMYRWLHQFAYHISLQPWYFLLAGFITVSIAFLSVSYHAIRVARSRPVNSLRSE